VVNRGRATPLVTVIIPTHDHASTLDLAIGSVLTQSVDSLELVVIGDGVGDDTRDVMAGLADPRIRFVDEPKTPSRAELTRHRVLKSAASNFACYLGDDDVMLVDHIETMVATLQDVDFAHPLPIYIAADGTFAVHPTDVGNAACRNWHLKPEHNAISLTGVAHRLDAYRRLPAGWREPPEGWHSDHFMWAQWFRTPGLEFATGRRLTVLKFEASLRVGWTPARRRAELVEWIDRSADPGFDAWLHTQVVAALQESSSTFRLLYSDLLDMARGQQAQAESTLSASIARISELEGDLATLQGLHDEQQELRRALSATRTWRLHDRITLSRPLTWAQRRRGR
jgi:GalNAc5-diNAcBac-PP-undecaprenol beta-1,3-glucosyltransferase